jgi:hypothetical protein
VANRPEFVAVEQERVATAIAAADLAVVHGCSAQTPHTAQQAPRVQFQDIIYEGLLGSDYLDRHRYTIDFDEARMLLEAGH